VLLKGHAKWEIDVIAYQELKNQSGTPGRLGLLIVKHFWDSKTRFGGRKLNLARK